MIIKWLGLTGIQIKSKNRIIVIDPPSEKTGLKTAPLKADILAISQQSPEIDIGKIKSRKEGQLFTIKDPGEYEIKEVIVRGIETKGKVTIYTFYLENVSVAHLGAFSQKELADHQLEELNKVDILLLPIGGQGGLDSERAIDLSQQIEPKLVIPINYQIKGLKKKLDSADSFLKSEGAEKIEPQSELNISQAKLPQEESGVALLKPQF
jgi:L-ascorbate metabolism protein UlaG (beta-lactamase superfamily)